MGRWIDFEGGYKTMDVRNNPLLCSALLCSPLLSAARPVGHVTGSRIHLCLCVCHCVCLCLTSTMPVVLSTMSVLLCSVLRSALFCAMLCCAALCCAVQTTYMESVWWVFKTLFDKGLVYRGAKQSALSFPHPPDADAVWLSRACLANVIMSHRRFSSH
jgi:hypothetical protein